MLMRKVDHKSTLTIRFYIHKTLIQMLRNQENVWPSGVNLMGRSIQRMHGKAIFFYCNLSSYVWRNRGLIKFTVDDNAACCSFKMLVLTVRSYNFDRVRVSACRSCVSDNNFRKQWRSKFIFAHLVSPGRSTDVSPTRRFADKLFDPEKWINAAKNNRPQLWIEFL